MNLASYSFAVVDSLSALTIVGHAIILTLIIALLLGKRGEKFSRPFASHALGLMFIIALIATLGSLYFSEIAGWNPCKLCWLQRIFMYPQVVLLSIALWKRDATVARYILGLSLIGAVIAAYHYYIQMYDIIAAPDNPATPCDTSGESCVKTPFTHFGYITIPMMALTAFALNIAGSMLVFKKQKTSLV